MSWILCLNTNLQRRSLRRRCHRRRRRHRHRHRSPHRYRARRRRRRFRRRTLMHCMSYFGLIKDLESIRDFSRITEFGSKLISVRLSAFLTVCRSVCPSVCSSSRNSRICPVICLFTNLDWINCSPPSFFMSVSLWFGQSATIMTKLFMSVSV